MREFDKKINEIFPGLVVRKDLVKTVKGNAIVPSYVLEYLLGQYCATDNEETIASGIEMVKKILKDLTIKIEEEFPDLPNARWVAMRLLEGDQKILDSIRSGELNSIIRSQDILQAKERELA